MQRMARLLVAFVLLVPLRHSAYDISEQTVSSPLTEIGDCVTIEDTAYDNGSLACERKSWSSPGSHRSTASAVGYLTFLYRACSPVIVGHGNTGFITTGLGQGSDFSLSGQYVGTWNQADWAPLLKRLINWPDYKVLTLLSCDTGADQAGADLLYSLATITKHTVRARTGLTSCGGNGIISYESASTWQVALPPPASPPGAIAKPHAPVAVTATPYFISKGKAIPIESIKSMEVRGPGGQSKRRAVTLSAERARLVLRLVRFDARVALTGTLAAIETARLTVYFMVDGRLSASTFIVYNERVVQDLDDPNTYYYVGKGFAETIQEVLKQR
jgi:hypothetical protein